MTVGNLNRGVSMPFARPAARIVITGWLATAAAVATTAHAQTLSTADGLRVNVHAGAVVLSGDDAEAGTVRPGVSVAYGNSRLFSVFITCHRIPATDGDDDFRLRHIDAGVRMHMRDESARVVPFLIAAYTWRHADYGVIHFMGDTQHVAVSGAGLTFGAGTAYYMAPRWAIEGSVKRTGAALDRVTASNYTFRDEASTIRAASWRVNIGISWWYPRTTGSSRARRQRPARTPSRKGRTRLFHRPRRM